MHKEIETAVYFEDIGWEIRKLLVKSTQSIRICVAWIGWNVYRDVLEKAALRGVDVEVIFNADEKNRFAAEETVPRIKFYPIRMPGNTRYMHNKFCVIDDETLITGSYNWSRAAERHFENIIVLKHAYKAMKEYIYEFYELIDYHNEWQSYRWYPKCLAQHNGYNLRCQSHTYNIGLFGNESGRHQSSETEVWRVCNADYRHVQLEGSFSENFLMTHLGLTAEDFEYDEEVLFDKELMLEQVKRERQRSKRLFDYFENGRNIKVHAIGFITSVEQMHKYDDYPDEKEIRIVWRNPYYRKIIPTIMHDDGTIDDILNHMRPY